MDAATGAQVMIWAGRVGIVLALVLFVVAVVWTWIQHHQYAAAFPPPIRPISPVSAVRRIHAPRPYDWSMDGEA